MKWETLIAIVRFEPVFSTGLLLTAGASRADVVKQLSRWTASGKVIQLRRGLYSLAPPYRHDPPHPFDTANRLCPSSYVSLQSALEFHGLIPEAVPTVTSVTTRRPETFKTAAGAFLFRHIQKKWFLGYTAVSLGGGRSALVARPEKALLDLIYLTPGSDNEAWLSELRLQNLDTLDETLLSSFVRAASSPKLNRALELILRLKRDEGFEAL